MSSELQRIQQHYQKRDSAGGATSFWTLFNPVVLHIAQQRERILLAMAKRHCVSFEGARVLDVGCGGGGEMVNLTRWGGSVSEMTGIDMSATRLRSASNKFGLRCVQAGGNRLPFADGCFDVVMQNVVFSSIVDADVRHSVAAEMQRVLAPGGMVIWYDARWSRSRDPAFSPLPRRTIEQLFGSLQFHWRSLTTDLGVLKMAEKLGGGFAMALVDKFPLLRTHLLGFGFKPHD